MSEEWGPWIEHDGKGCPILMGVFAEAVRRDGRTAQGIVGRGDHGPYSAWLWGVPHTCPTGEVVEYRVKKPRGLTILENLIADLPAPVGPKVDA